jgi:hypothetical protein
MRPGERAEAIAMGKEPRRLLRASYRNSLVPPKAAFVDGAIAAIWGLGGDILSDTGAPWLVTAGAIERVPVSFVRIARLELMLMLEVRPHLENYVAADYRKAIRLLETLGFILEVPEPIGPKRALFRRFWIERQA